MITWWKSIACKVCNANGRKSIGRRDCSWCKGDGWLVVDSEERPS